MKDNAVAQLSGTHRDEVCRRACRQECLHYGCLLQLAGCENACLWRETSWPGAGQAALDDKVNCSRAPRRQRLQQRFACGYAHCRRAAWRMRGTNIHTIGWKLQKALC